MLIIGIIMWVAGIIGAIIIGIDDIDNDYNIIIAFIMFLITLVGVLLVLFSDNIQAIF